MEQSNKVYKISGKEVKLKKLTLGDWQKVYELLKQINIPNNTEITSTIAVVVTSLFEQNLIKKFLDLILVCPVEVDLYEIEEDTLLEVITDFFYSKQQLIESTFKKLTDSQLKSSDTPKE